jgi:hypothetical protein
MMYKSFSLILLAFLLFSCKNTPNNQQNTTTTEGGQTTQNVLPPATPDVAQVTPVTDKAIQNFTILPYQQVGSITAATTEGGLKTLFGEQNVVRDNRGDVQTVIFKGTANELQIAWKAGAAFKKIESVIIMGKGAKWRTPEGIGIGSNLKELEAANGKSVTLAPIGEEEEGIFRPLWNGGKIHPKLVVSYDKTADKVFAIQINF